MDQVAAVVQACIDAIGTAGEYYGLRRVVVEPAGRLATSPEGVRTIRIKVRMVYQRKNTEETREATIVCAVLPDGRVHLRPDGAYVE